MRVLEKCSCGGQVELNYSMGKTYPYENEVPQAEKRLREFRKIHKECAGKKKENDA